MLYVVQWAHQTKFDAHQTCVNSYLVDGVNQVINDFTK